jgi:hypothetical protein
MDKLIQHQAFCDLPFRKIIINGWGDLSLCCYQLQQLGNVLKDGKTIKEIWDSPLAQEIRQYTNEGKLHPVCTSWNTCPFIVSEKWYNEFEMHKDHAYPTYLEICLPNTHCNIGGENPNEDNPACIMCCRNYEFKKQPPITDLLCEKAKPLMPYLRYLCVLGVAEPFWKDAVFRVFDKLDFAQYKEQITFTTNTNVICLVERNIDRFFQEVHKSDISFSLDAATPETYIKIRRVDGYHLVLKNLQTFMDYRDRNGGSERHKVYIYNNINILNVHEMVGMVETAYDLGIGRMIMLPTHDQCGRVDMEEFLLNEKNVKVFKKAAEAAKKRADDLGVLLHYSKPFDVVPPPVGQYIEPPHLVQLQVATQ